MADTIREQIIQAVISRLGIVRTSKGYNTNCGRNVIRAERKRDSDKVESFTIWPGMDENDPKYSANAIEFPLIVEAEKAFTSTTNPSELGEQLLGDMVEALVGYLYALPFTSGGTTVPKGGDTLTGETSGATAIIEDITVSSGAWANGDAAGTFYVRRLVGTFQAEEVSVSGSNVATLAGTMTGQNGNELSTNSLADILYSGGGIEVYPEISEGSIGVKGEFKIRYNLVNGDPYNLTT